jgi:hypothetical protein
MGSLIRSAGAVAAGLAAAFIFVMGVEWMSSVLHPFLPGVDPSNIEACKAHVARYPAGVLLLAGVGWGLGPSSAVGFPHASELDGIPGGWWEFDTSQSCRQQVQRPGFLIRIEYSEVRPQMKRVRPSLPPKPILNGRSGTRIISIRSPDAL